MGYEGVNWALTGIAGVLTIGRFVIRGYNSRRLFWDDLVHLLAFVALVIHGALSVADGNDRVAIDHAKQEKTPASVLLGLYQRLAHVSAANNCFLYSVFWLVKIGFLLFYYRLFNTSRDFRKAWWAVLAFTFLTYWVPIGGVISICGQSHTLADYEACSGGRGNVRRTRLLYSFAVNVATDLAIMALPLWMVKKLRITTSQKLGLVLIFSLAIFCIALEILRIIEALVHQQALFTILEVNFFVIISCLPTYRALLNIDRQRLLYRPSKLSTWEPIEKGSSPGSKENGIELTTNAIHVTNGYHVSNEERGPYSVEPPGTISRDLILPEPAHTTTTTVSPPYRSPV